MFIETSDVNMRSYIYISILVWQVIIEIPYVFLQVGIFVIITYPAVGFYCSVYKVVWYFFTMFCTMLYYTYLGMLLVSTSGSLQVAFVMSSFSNTIMSLFSGFLIPEPVRQFELVFGSFIFKFKSPQKTTLITQHQQFSLRYSFVHKILLTNIVMVHNYARDSRTVF